MEAMFKACEKRSWLQGFCFWDWSATMPTELEAKKDSRYELCRKPVKEIIKSFYIKK